MTPRALLFAAASAAALFSTTAAMAADAAPATQQVEELVVTGTRGEARSRLESLSPVDVVNAQALQRQGTTELGAALSVTVPAIDFPRPSNTDGTDAIRPATLHGQGPDETLVLMNSNREHTSALVNLNGSVGRGSAAFDLNSIPTIAIDHIEILRDGASALYGSDAVAGVINLILRQADHGGGASATYGQYDTSFDGFFGGTHDRHDGATGTVDAWQGFKLGSDGFLTVSGEYKSQRPTNRSDNDPRFPALGVDSRFGDPEVHQTTGYFNAGKPLGDGWELLAYGGGQERRTESAATFRAPNDLAKNIASVYPNGFLPHILTHSYDYTIGSNLKNDDLFGWHSNFGVNYGWNKLRYDTIDTINVSLGPNSPHAFYAGKLVYGQLVGNADFNRDFDVGMAGPLNVAFGAEARNERYSIGAGNLDSYEKGTFQNGTTAAGVGAQGFPGFQPDNAVDVSRTNVGAYIALEAQPIEPLKLSGAIREEHYSDFGDNTSGKVSFRYELTPALAFRGSAESGFRAPSLQQEFFTSTASLFVNVPGQGTVQFDTGTFPATSATAKALGAQPLQPEKSKNYSLGTVFHASGLEVTLDAYEIDVTNRIVLSETLTGSNTAAVGTDARAIFTLLQPTGASAARFFINGVDTKTRGLDAVATYRVEPMSWGNLTITASGNMNDLEVTKTPATPTSVLPIPMSLFARQNTYRFERETPKYKAGVQGDWSLDNWGAMARATFYGDVLAPGTTDDGLNDIHTGAQTLVDLEGRYNFSHGIELALGAENLFDVYPKQIPVNLDTTGAGPFSSFSPFGFNGRRLYARLSATW
ncbi:MAG: TonB-dependent receptor [Phenylobacterium sp.]|nr:MAG: TonB-dependent receptor [Phenylobacterium sp.]